MVCAMNDGGLENPSFATVCLHRLIDIKGVSESQNANGVICRKNGFSYSALVDSIVKPEPSSDSAHNERKTTPCKRSCDESCRIDCDDSTCSDNGPSAVLRLQDFSFSESNDVSSKFANQCNSLQTDEVASFDASIAAAQKPFTNHSNASETGGAWAVFAAER